VVGRDCAWFRFSCTASGVPLRGVMLHSSILTIYLNAYRVSGSGGDEGARTTAHARHRNAFCAPYPANAYLYLRHGCRLPTTIIAVLRFGFYLFCSTLFTILLRTWNRRRRLLAVSGAPAVLRVPGERAAACVSFCRTCILTDDRLLLRGWGRRRAADGALR